MWAASWGGVPCDIRGVGAGEICRASGALYGTILRLSVGLAQTGKHRGVRTRLRSAGGEISHGSTPERCVVWRTFWGRVVNRSCRAREPRGGPTIFGGVAPEKSVARQGAALTRTRVADIQHAGQREALVGAVDVAK